MRALLLLMLLPFLATFAPIGLATRPEIPRTPTLWVEPVPLREGAPGGKRLGALTFMEGWWLRSNHPQFGGISAIHVNGRSVLAISDGGMTMRFDVPTSSGAVPIAMRALADAPGPSKKQRDSEAMAVQAGRAWIAFERENAVFRYDVGSWRSNASAKPQEMRRWPLNSGSEAMVRLRDGRFLIFSEGYRTEDDVTEVLLFTGDPAIESTKVARLSYRPPAGFRITDAAELPDGRLLFLNRRISIFDGILAKMTISEPPDLRPGSIINGREIAHFQPPVTTDNYEALSIGQEGGRTVLWIASDDNFMGMQRSLLLKFALEE